MSGQRFSHFVILAEMRTGSNFLEQNINQFADLHSYGELFNPHFIGGANKKELFGVSLNSRETNPFALLDGIKTANPDSIPGFRFFNDHDPRILENCLADKDCAKVILTRNALDSYVSRKIAAATGQWKLTNLKHKKTVKIEFDENEFSKHLETTQGFQIKLLNTLQASGQTAFYINYDDIHSLDILNGLARFLGSEHQVDNVNTDLKKQNPSSLKSKVTNYTEMKDSLGKIDFMGLSRTPNFEPRRGAGVPQIIVGDASRIAFIPIKGGPDEAVKNWLAAHENVSPGDLTTGFNQKDLRRWRRQHSGFKSICVIRHPVLRAYTSFCDYIVATEVGAYREVRKTLIQQFGVSVPKNESDKQSFDKHSLKAAFIAFLKFLKLNLANQTSVRVDPAWASQTALLEAVSQVLIPGQVILESELQQSITHIENLLSLKSQPINTQSDDHRNSLADIYDKEIESLVRDTYMRDYLNFGFGSWQG